MYNTRKRCPKCGWSVLFDFYADVRGIGEFMYCPKCMTKLDVSGYSPDI